MLPPLGLLLSPLLFLCSSWTWQHPYQPMERARGRASKPPHVLWGAERPSHAVLAERFWLSCARACAKLSDGGGSLRDLTPPSPNAVGDCIWGERGEHGSPLSSSETDAFHCQRTSLGVNFTFSDPVFVDWFEYHFVTPFQGDWGVFGISTTCSFLQPP